MSTDKHASQSEALNTGNQGPNPETHSLFTAGLAPRTWCEFTSEGFDQPVSGMIFRGSDPPCCGVALGGLGTGCLDIEASGVLGFNTLFPAAKSQFMNVYRNAQILLPFLGISMAGRTWVLATEKYIQGGASQGCTEPGYQKNDQLSAHFRVEVPPISGVEHAQEIHYWGHYPVADMEYETSSPVRVGLRAWAPFIPGNLAASGIPAAVFEVHLSNTTEHLQRGTLAFSFPGPFKTEPAYSTFRHAAIAGPFQGVHVTTSDEAMGYVLGCLDGHEPNGVVRAIRSGGALSRQLDAWSQIAAQLPIPGDHDPGAALAIDFELAPSANHTLRFILAWYAPFWTGGSYTDLAWFESHWGPGPYEPPGRENKSGVRYTAMYAARFTSALQVAQLVARDHASLLERTLAWQRVIYTSPELPVWLRDCLVNNLNLIPEDSYWAQPRDPLEGWSFPDGAFGLVESPRGCAIVGCIVSNFYGDFPILYFFPQLERMILRNYQAYQRPDGAAAFLFPNGDFTKPTYEWLLPLNGPCFVDLVDRLWRRTGDDNLLREFYASVKANTRFTMTLRPPPEGILTVHREGVGQEWWEHTPVYGMVTHMGGMRLSNCCIAKRMAEAMGDLDFARQCQEWFQGASRLLEQYLWDGDSYLSFRKVDTSRTLQFEHLKGVAANFGSPEIRSDDIMSSQLDGEWANIFHGLGGVFQPERVRTVLDTIYRTCLIDCGVVGFANKAGAPQVKDYGTFAAEITMVGMTYLYHGQHERGLEIIRRNMDNLVRKQGYAWDLPNMVWADSGARSFGTDYYQNMILWAVPAALAGQDVKGPCQTGGLVDRILRAANP